jgi:hypothetical protein
MALLMMFAASSVAAPAFASVCDIPLQMMSMRDRLLGDRSKYLYQRSDLNQRLTAMRSMQLEIDRLLSSNVSDCQYRDLSAAKNRLLNAQRDLQRQLDDVEKALINNNQDLANVEYNIQRFACLR